MITSKRISIIAAVIVATMLVLTLLAMAFGDEFTALMGGGEGVSMYYEDTLFNTNQPITINIEMDEEDWSDMLENAASEEYALCDIVINGKSFSNVGIRPKGNTSLSQVISSDSDRYSFKVEFNHYVEDQTCWGLDKLVLNNCFGDATMMKEYLSYDMFDYLGADASLYNYAVIYVNGEYWGVYLALEAVEESFMVRNYGTNYGEAYKPDSLNFGGAGRMQGVEMADMLERMQEAWGTGWQDATGNGTATDFGAASASDLPAATERANRPGNMPNASGSDLPGQGRMPEATSTDRRALQGGGMGGGPGFNLPGQEGKTEATSSDQTAVRGGGMAGNGNISNGSGSASAAELNYLGDDLEDYSTIWEASVFDSSDSDHTRVVEALKNISEGNDLEEYMDVDNLLKYMAVQTFVENLDSLTGNMAHNYYLYEEDGQLNLIPWDYNLAFGGFQSADASDTVNFPIDTPFTSSLENREFFAALLENEEYLNQYHEYLRTLVEKYVLGGEFTSVYQKIRSQIDDLVAADPTAFYSYEEYDAAAQMLCSLITLRGESVLGQLNGTIPSTTQGQEADSSALIDASAIDLSVMGSMNTGGGNGGANGGGGNASAASGTDFAPFDGARASGTDLAPGDGVRASGTDLAASGGFGDGNAAMPGGESSASDQSSPPGRIAAQSTPSYNMTTVYWLLGCLGVMMLALPAVKIFRRK